MAETLRSLDVWLVKRNTVYKQVPFMVVIDWIQEGRILEDDQVRKAGSGDWQRLGDHSLLAPYLPRPESLPGDESTEAIEEIALDFSWGRSKEYEDDDVDMIPLIDISMVLLVFFMMTAQALLTGTGISDLPAAKNARAIDAQGGLVITIKKTEDGNIVYENED